jgi:spermidine synthase
MIPFHLTTKEFLEEVKAKLADNAVVVSNIAIEKDAQLYPWMLRTYQNAFGTLFEGNIPGTINRVLIGKAGKSAFAGKDIVSRSRAMQSKIAMGYDLAGCAGIFRDVSSRQASDKVLTDDYAPVNLMKLRKADEKDWEY